MCGIAGVIYKDRKTHQVGEALTSMLESLQHRGPDSAGYAIYGGLNFPENFYQLNIEVNRRRGTLDNLKSYLNQISPIFEEELIESVGDSDVYKCKISLDSFSLLKPLISELDELKGVQVINGSHSFEMIKDIGKVKDIAERFNVKNRVGTHGIGHTRFATESGVDRYHAHPYQSYIIPDITVVHNGQITNYWKIRDPLERKGHKFESFNDTECIVHYMADKLDQGYKLEEALDQYNKEMAEKARQERIARMLEQQRIARENNITEILAQPSGDEYVWPCPGYTYLTALFAEERYYGIHGAIDIAGAGIYGANVIACAPGTVIYAAIICPHDYGKEYSCGCGGGFGNYIMIDHGNGKISIYAHLSGIIVEAGQEVKAGQVIGYVGTTGYSTGPHLHFETRYDGVRYDPLLEFE